MVNNNQELFNERTSRVEKAIRLETPDRVPIVVRFGYFPAKYTGITCEDAFYDFDKWRSACKKTLLDFEPDMYHFGPVVSGPMLEALDCRQAVWPGHGASPNHTHQFIEGEYMKADEYDAFLEDPSDFAIRTYLPRVYGTLEPFNRLFPPRLFFYGYEQLNMTEVLAEPDMVQAFESMYKAAREAQKWLSGLNSFHDEMTNLGFPRSEQSITHAPFDLISGYFRGMRGIMLDMYRQPDKLLEACDKILPWSIQKGISMAKNSGNPRVFIPLHKGAEGFMSLKQFETFYWPNLKKLILALIDEDLTPCPFFEGGYTSRLEYLLELPRGKVCGYFDSTDLFKAKEILNNQMCIRGNVPASLLQTGTPQEVKDHCKKLIDVVGKGGGYIMDSRNTLDEAEPENLKAMFDFTREYGKY